MSAFTNFNYNWQHKLTGYAANIEDVVGTVSYNYDEATGEMKSDANTGTVDTFKYDTRGNVLRQANGREFTGYTNTETFTRHYNANNQWDGYNDAQGVLKNKIGNIPTNGLLFQYDANGNPTIYSTIYKDTQGQIVDKTFDMSYDAENRLTTIDDGNTWSSYGYRDDGLRARKDDRYFLYDGSNVVCELNADGDLLAAMTWGPQGLVSRKEYSDGTVATAKFYQFDILGNTAVTLDATGTAVGYSDFTAYGERSAGAADVYGYKAQFGYYTDTEYGFILCGHRFYDPNTGRWLNQDPIGYAGGLNLYAYCGNEPVGGVDASGYKAFGSSADFSLGNWGNARLVLDEDGSYSVYLPGRGWVPLYHTDEDDKYGQVLDENNNQIKRDWDQCLNPEEIKVAMSHEGELIPAFREWKRNQSLQSMPAAGGNASATPFADMSYKDKWKFIGGKREFVPSAEAANDALMKEIAINIWLIRYNPIIFQQTALPRVFQVAKL